MALPATDFVNPFSFSFTQTSSLEMIKGIYDGLTANSPTYITITDYSATEAHIELSVSGQTDMRILFFGGQTPNSGAIYGSTTLSANYVYCLCAPGVGTTGPDQSYTVGNPYTGSEINSGGVVASSYVSTWDLIRFFECSDGVGIFFARSGATAFGGGIAGGLLQSPDKETLRYVASGTGAGAVSSVWASATSGASCIQVESVPSSADAICSCIIEGYGNAVDAYRCERILSGNNLKDTDGRGVLIPIVLASDTGNVCPGTFRGIYMGSRATFGNTVNGTNGWAMAGADETDALYFANI